METFAFPNIYNGVVFYAKYKGAMFLQNQQNVVNVLSGSQLLHNRMETMTPGQPLLIEGMLLNLHTPLIIKKGNLIDDSDVDGEDFTPHRLLSLTATYLYESRDKLPDLYETLKTEVLRLIGNKGNIPNTITHYMKTFVYSEAEEPQKFNDQEFYKKYKGALFLQDKQNIDKILSKEHELCQRLNTLAAGESLQMKEMFIDQNTPLVVHKSYRLDESDVAGSDFTLRRLSGLTARYVAENRDKFPDLYRSPEPEARGQIRDSAHVPNTDIMKKFAFSRTKIPRKFDDKEFYEKYKEAAFLQEKQNIDNILCKQHELTQCLDALASGESLQIEGMFLEPNTPLVVKKGYRLDESDVDGLDFTLRRLSGLTALYVDNNRDKFPDLRASEPESFGIDWKRYPRLYLSAVSGTEIFINYFYGLIIALKRYQLKQITEEELMRIAMIRVSDGETEAENYMKEKDYYDDEVPSEFKHDKLMKTLPAHIKCFFMG